MQNRRVILNTTQNLIRISTCILISIDTEPTLLLLKKQYFAFSDERTSMGPSGLKFALEYVAKSNRNYHCKFR